MKKLTLEKTLYNMWTENTGTSILDSGGASGRNWQRNQKKTIESLNNEPSGYVEYYFSERHGLEITGTASMWHHLNNALELDEVCHEFNSMDVDNWDSEVAYGLSNEGEQYLNYIGAKFEKTWNTYNWDNNFDAVLQGCNLTINDEDYVLIQYHGGADVRGGYTDAKLFKIDNYLEDYFIYEDGVYGEYFEELEDGFDVCSREGGAVLQSSGCTEISEEMKELIIAKHGLSEKNNSIIVNTSSSEF